MKATKLVAATVVSIVACQAQASIITNVTKINGNDEVPVVVTQANLSGLAAYTDRTHVLKNAPIELVDADLIQLSNSDKESTDVKHEVTVGNNTLLYVGLDDRLTSQPLPWMLDQGMTGLGSAFFDTGRQIDIDEGNDGTIDNTFSLWAAVATSNNTYTLLEQNDGGSRNMYIAFADNKLIVPEPASLSLIAVGLLGLLNLRRQS